MAIALRVESEDEAISLFHDLVAGRFEGEELEALELGEWVNSVVHLELGLHSEITPPFMEAFLEAQHALYRLVAQVKYGNADIRHLSVADLDKFQIKVRVTEGSSNFLGEWKDTLEKLASEAMGKMTGAQILGLVLGAGLLFSANHGWKTYLEHKKELRAAEIQSEERKQAVESQQFATQESLAITRQVVDYLVSQGPVHSRVVDTSAEIQGAILKAASKTPQSEIGGQHLTRGEARELRASPRRSAQHVIVEQEMRVIDINTSDPAMTTIVIESIPDRQQYKVTFQERLVQERDLEKMHSSLQRRDTIWLRLDIREVGGEPRAVQIVRVVEPPMAEIVVAENSAE